MQELDSIKLELKKQIAMSEKQIALWKNVTRVYKKGGGDFQSLGRNFTGCKVEQKAWGSSDDMELVVADWTPAGGYVKDHIDLKALVEDMPKPVAQSRIVKIAGLKPYVILSPQEIEVAIAARIKRLEGDVASYRSQFILADKAYEAFKEAIDNALRDLKSIAGDRSTLYYRCRDYMRNVY